MPAILTRGLCRAGLAAASLLAAAAAPARAPNAPKPPREDLTIDPAAIMHSWTGDLDGMVERRQVRVLVVPGKTTYLQGRGQERGATYDALKRVEEELNQRLAREKKPKRKHLPVKFFFVAIRRDQLLPALVEGKGDIAAVNLTITPERTAVVDFAAPIGTDVSEVVLTGPASPAVSTLDDLAGKEVFVRRSSSYHASMTRLNERFAEEGKAPVALEEAPEELEDEDLIEMLDAGLLSVLEHEPMTQLDKALFAFAAYNAGPGRIAQLRREAARRGLDPDVWFHNVELVAAEKVGSETVTYVSNTFKYHVAYRRMMETYQERRQAIESLEGGSDRPTQRK